MSGLSISVLSTAPRLSATNPLSAKSPSLAIAPLIKLEVQFIFFNELSA